MKHKIERDTTSSSLKKSYKKPTIHLYGKVSALTNSGASGSHEGSGSANPYMSASDPRVKENVQRVGNHYLGVGLYLFDYRQEFRDEWGHGRQFGVMANEVEKVMPEAVSIHPHGIKVVNYEMLGIERVVN